MEDILYLTHRIPWPPNKGDKIRAHHILQYLVRHYRVHLGTFIDDPADAAWLPELEGLCASVHAVRLDPRLARVRSLSGLFTGEALTVPFYRNAGLQQWVDSTIADNNISRGVVFSSAMAQFTQGIPGLRCVLDMVDVDSEKWRQYSGQKPWPWSWIYGREADRLLAFERQAAEAAVAGLLVSPEEAALFRRLTPGSSARITHVRNGVDADYFDPAREYPNLFPEHEIPLVFTGAMDYWPNQDAVQWFAQDIFPKVRAAMPEAVFYIVGSRPSELVKKLANEPRVVVTGFVDDVRPYIAHSAAVVAPLRVARGVQNKVLEAMAMARPVLLTQAALEGISAEAEREVLLCDAPQAFISKLRTLPNSDYADLGQAARARVLADFTWESNLRSIRGLLEDEDVSAPSPLPELEGAQA